MRQEELWLNIQQLVELKNNMSFQQLHRQINSFNTFKVLKLENYEIRHSNMFVWLLDPYENHWLQHSFIRHCKKEKPLQLIEYSPIHWRG